MTLEQRFQPRTTRFPRSALVGSWGKLVKTALVENELNHLIRNAKIFPRTLGINSKNLPYWKE